MRARPLFALLPVLGSLAFASTADAAPRDLEVSGKAVAIEQHPHYDTPRFLSGKFVVRTASKDPVEIARTFLRAQRSVLGIDRPDQELQVTRVIAEDELGLSHVRFQQLANGIPVFGSELIVHLDGHVVESLDGAFLRSIRTPLRTRVQADDAADLALETLRDLIHTGHVNGEVEDRLVKLELQGEPELVYLNVGLLSDARTPTVPAWKVQANGYLLFMSALDGRLLEHADTIHAALHREIYNANNTQTTPGTLVCSESTGCSSSDLDVMNAWNQFGLVHAYFMNEHGRDSFDGNGSTLKGTVNYSVNFVNAYWNGEQMVFGDDMVALDVTAHELGHGVCQHTANLTYRYQPGALNESLSDVWGALVDSDDWLIGEDLSIGAIRSMSNPNDYNQPKDMGEFRRFVFYDNGGVHINSGIPNFAAYLLAAGGTHDGVTVVGQGREAVGLIWYRTETTRLTSSSKFADFANGAVRACGEIYGTGSPVCGETRKAFEAVGIL